MHHKILDFTPQQSMWNQDASIKNEGHIQTLSNGLFFTFLL